MDKDTQEEGSVSQLEEVEPSQLARAESGRASKLNRFIKLQTYQQLKEVVALDEIRLKLMKQGHDVSRSRLVSEAVKLLERAVAEGKFEFRG